MRKDSPPRPRATAAAAPDPSEPTTTTSTTLPSAEAEPNQDILTVVPGVLTVGTEALDPTLVHRLVSIDADRRLRIRLRQGARGSGGGFVRPSGGHAAGHVAQWTGLPVRPHVERGPRHRQPGSACRSHRAVSHRGSGRVGPVRRDHGQCRGGSRLPLGCRDEEQRRPRRARKAHQAHRARRTCSSTRRTASSALPTGGSTR